MAISNHSTKHHDFIVVGGGSAGCAVAAELVNRGYRVALVEAGPDYGAFDDAQWPADLVDAQGLADSHDWNYHADRWVFQRARVMGGCSSHNGCIAAVGHRQDYDDWKLPGWSSAEVAPVYKRVVDTMKVRTYQTHEAGPFHARCIEAATSAGWRIISDLCDLDGNDGFGLEDVNIVGHTRWNTAFAYIDPIRRQPERAARLTIIDRALVNTFEEHSNGVTLSIIRDNKTATISADQLILSAGVYGTPEILQRSGIGDPALLQKLDIPVRVPSVKTGLNLHDHPMIHVDRRVGPQLQQWLDDASASGFLPEEQTLGKAISSHAKGGLFDLHLFPLCASTQTSRLHGRVEIKVACMTPQSRGTLAITSKHPHVLAAIDHNYLGDSAGHDLAVLKDGVALANELFEQSALSELLGDPIIDTSTDAGIRQHVAHYYHPVGTCAMGLQSDDVCKPDGRVNGLERVAVADASLMPQIPRANTNLPSIMIGERIVELWLSCG